MWQVIVAVNAKGQKAQMLFLQCGFSAQFCYILACMLGLGLWREGGGDIQELSEWGNDSSINRSGDKASEIQWENESEGQNRHRGPTFSAAERISECQSPRGTVPGLVWSAGLQWILVHGRIFWCREVPGQQRDLPGASSSHDRRWQGLGIARATVATSTPIESILRSASSQECWEQGTQAEPGTAVCTEVHKGGHLFEGGTFHWPVKTPEALITQTGHGSITICIG